MAMSPTCVTVSRGGGEWQGLWPWELVCFEPGQGPYCKARCPLFSGDRGWSQVLAKDLLYEQQPRLERPLGWTVTPFVVQICKNLDELVKQYESESAKLSIRYGEALMRYGSFSGSFGNE